MSQSYVPSQTFAQWFDEFYNRFCDERGIAKIPFQDFTPIFTPEEAQKRCAVWLEEYKLRLTQEAISELFD